MNKKKLGEKKIKFKRFVFIFNFNLILKIYFLFFIINLLY